MAHDPSLAKSQGLILNQLKQRSRSNGYTPATRTKSFNLSKLKNTQIPENSTKQVNEKINNQISSTSNQEEWIIL